MHTWRLAHFDELSLKELHDIYHARLAVFVVEQSCPFQDVDGVDPACHHLFARVGTGPILAYARLVPPGAKFAEPSIGRVITTEAARRSGLGRELMRLAVGHCERMWPGQDVRIGAQKYLERFYGEFGFATVSAPYDEDGILHVEMLRRACARPERTARAAGH